MRFHVKAVVRIKEDYLSVGEGGPARIMKSTAPGNILRNLLTVENGLRNNTVPFKAVEAI